jgi:hypothetical protein
LQRKAADDDNLSAKEQGKPSAEMVLVSWSDPRKMWLVVGRFVSSSGIVCFDKMKSIVLSPVSLTSLFDRCPRVRAVVPSTPVAHEIGDES